MEKYKIAYVVSDLKRVGPSNQTLNIIKNSPIKDECIVITLFKETEDTMITEFEENNIRIICLNLNRNFFMINGIKILENVLNEYNVQLVHSYGIKPDNICQKVCNELNIVHIISLRNYPKEDILTRMNFIKGNLALYKHLSVLKKSNHIIACSKTIENKMKNDYPKMNITTIQNGVDISKYKIISKKEKEKIRKKLNLPLNKQIFISTNSFIKRKRIEESIEGFLKFNNRDSIYILLGIGEEFENIKNKYTGENIKFLGKSDIVNQYLAVSDFFISSSESEGLPNGVIEAIACGIPVILSNIPQHIEILDEVPNSGLVYVLGDATNLSEVIKKSCIKKFDSYNIYNSNLTMKKMSEKYYIEYMKYLKG